MTQTAHEIEVERKAEEERARKALREQEQSAMGELGGFMQFIIEMIKGFFGFLQGAISGDNSIAGGDGSGRELEEPGGKQSLFNGIKASGSAAVAWAKYQQEHKAEKVDHRSPIAGKATVGDDRHMREKHPIHGDRRMHHGLDIKGASGIVASEKGVILFSGTLRGYGNAFIIGHADGSYSLYGHLASINNAKAGETIEKGESIGVMGETGGAKGVHLHYEQRKGSQSVTPVINGRQITRGVPRGEMPSLADVGVGDGDKPASHRFGSASAQSVRRV